MAQLWGGRFTKETDDKVFAFNASIRFDKNLFGQDKKDFTQRIKNNWYQSFSILFCMIVFTASVAEFAGWLF